MLSPAWASWRWRPREGLHAADARPLAAGQEDDLVAHVQPAGHDPAGDDAPIVALLGELVDVLHRQAQGLVHGRGLLLQLSSSSRMVGPVYQDMCSDRAGHVVAFAGADRDEGQRLQADLRQELPVLVADGLEGLLSIAHQVHLVDAHGDLADAQHAHQVAVPARVLLHPLGHVDHQQARLGPGRPGDHVLEKLDVARRVDDDVLALGGVEEAPRRVDGDALGLLVLERIQQEGVLEGLGVAAARLLDLLQLALGQRAGVGQEPADERALAVVHVADDHDVHLLACNCRFQIRDLRFSEVMLCLPFVTVSAMSLYPGCMLNPQSRNPHHM